MSRLVAASKLGRWSSLAPRGVSPRLRVGKALERLKDGLWPFVEREMKSQFGEKWSLEIQDVLRDTRLGGKNNLAKDVAVQLVVMDRKWSEVFRKILGKAERSLVNELIDVRNRWAHQDSFSSDDADGEG